MKWIVLAGIISLATGCCTTTPEVIGYRQVNVVSVKTMAVTPCCTKIIAVKPVVTRVVTPVIEPVLVDYVEPVDVTTTTVDFY